MLTFPPMLFVPDAPAAIPPAMFAARDAALRLFVPRLRTPFTVRAEFVVRFEDAVSVTPELTVRALNCWLPALTAADVAKTTVEDA